jgi:hypothetical protein
MPEEPLQSRLQSSPSCSLPSRPSRGRRSRAPLRHSLPHPAAPVQHQPQPRSAGRRRALRRGSRPALGRTGWPAPRALGGSRGCAPEDAKCALEFLSTPAEQIDTASICTVCHKHDLYSHCAEGQEAGRGMALVALTSPVRASQ